MRNTIKVCVSQRVYSLLSGIGVSSVYGYYTAVYQLLNLCTVERNVPEHSGNCEVRGSNISWDIYHFDWGFLLYSLKVNVRIVLK